MMKKKPASNLPQRTLEQVQGENAAVLHAIGVKTFQVHTLELEITGLEARVRELNREAAAIQAAVPKEKQ